MRSGVGRCVIIYTLLLLGCGGPEEGLGELYQGLGVVLVGGLTFSTILTPTVVPALMGLFKDWNLVESQSEED